MKSERTSFQVDLAKLYALATPSSFSGSGGAGQPNPDEPLKPGPWDPVIRVALKDMLRFDRLSRSSQIGPDPVPWRFGPQPEPWVVSMISEGLLALIGRRFPAVFDVIGGSPNFADEVALNPQPLPPRERFIAALGEALVSRAEQLAEVAQAFGERGEERGIIIVSGYVSRLVDEWCGNGYRPRWPFPGPPPWWFRAEVSGRDILTLGASLHRASREAFQPTVSRALSDAAGKLAQVGLERM